EREPVEWSRGWDACEDRTRLSAPYLLPGAANDRLQPGMRECMKRVAHRFQISCRIRAITAQSREPPTRLPVNHQPARVTRATVVVPGRMPGTHNVRLDQPPSRAPVTYVVQRNLSFARAKRDRGLLDPFEPAREMQTFLFPPVS